ncbi:hypothetical protein [Polaribacter aquimarinus]|uniref:Uncharacterized protein n=1 Tax=Polaribacter aquimarinus TaxID=2100726 RepID=A0A2U2JE74_9FLAO|nr:hypothetical protein [Polaribacter aquimarinus]PWG06571.1 hypothetical protein DIS07_01680 [Polaribacter aquimarinus]
MATQNDLVFNINDFKFINSNQNNELHNQITFKFIKNVLKDDNDYLRKVYLITYAVFEITKKELLINTLKLFSNINFKEISDIIDKKISYQITSNQKFYTKENFVRIYSMVLSVFLRREVLILAKIDNRLVSDFHFEINNYEITFNDLFNIEDKLILHFNLNFNHFLNDLEVKQYLNFLYDEFLIKQNPKIDIYSNYVEKKISQRINDQDILKEKSKHIFSDLGFNIFMKWKEINEDEVIKKYSFIFQKLNQENLLRDTKFKSHILWLDTNNIISENEVNDIKVQNYWTSPKNILQGHTRNDLYKFIKKQFSENR